ncbi:hypothetical protein [Pseudonocardia sp. NPDC049154]|uniref:DUF6933 domain-containing protein n=1 Tax=Pseudonocardia sp. NPDC049154 TaxID=3155501 RepID=UPI00340EAA2A
MMLRCTGKLLSLLRLRPAVAEASPADWYANLLWVDGRKCLLLTHARTVFSVFVSDVAAAELRPPGLFVVTAIAAALRSEALPRDALGELDEREVTVARTLDRRVLGTMNDHAVMAQHVVAAAGGLSHCDVESLNHQLHRTINSLTGHTPPIELITRHSKIELCRVQVEPDGSI